MEETRSTQSRGEGLSVITQPSGDGQEGEAASEAGNGKPLSPTSRMNLLFITKKLQSGEVKWVKDDAGNPIPVYNNQRTRLNYVDKSDANKIATPKSEQDTQNRIEACLEMIDFLKTNRSPRGVVLDNKKIGAKSGQYREGHEFEKLEQVLGKGAMAGDIVVVKDKKSETDHAQKTVMISEFRKEEVQAWVDLGSEGMSPSLYSFQLEGNKIVFRMEKLDRAITIRDVIDSHMNKIRNEDPDLVRPFSLYVFHGLLSAVRSMHDKNWAHKDLHGGNVMLQETDESLQLKIIDFGRASPIRGDDRVYDVRGEQDDIYQVVRLFSAIYTGQEFDSAHHLKTSYKEEIEQIVHLPLESRTEIFQLIDTAMSVAENGTSMDDTIDCLNSKLGDKEARNNMLKKVAAILFKEEDFMSLHGDVGCKGDDGVDVCDAGYSLEEHAQRIPDDFLDSLRLGISLRRKL